MLFLPFLFVLKTTSAQMSGDFWWLNEKVAALNGAHASPVAYGDLNDLGTDESDMVIFRYEEATETNKITKKATKELKHKKEIKNNFIVQNPIHTSIVFFPETETTTKKNYDLMIQPSNNDELIFKDTVYYNSPIKDMKITNSHGSNHTDVDEMELIFPITENITSGHKSKNDSTTNELSITDDPHAISDTNSEKQEIFKTNTENICTPLTVVQCKQRNGTVYYKPVSSTKQVNKTCSTICCILPIIMRDSSWRMIFSDELVRRASRRKRETRKSRDRDSVSKENQRSFLLRIRLGALNKSATSSARPLRKIVNSDYEYEDPYWNIKNTKPAQHDYVETDYDEDFASELPKPGKLGSYPKQSGGPSPFEWASSNGDIKQKGNEHNRDSHKGYDRGPVIDDRSDHHNSKTDSSISNVDDFTSSEEDDAIDPFVRYTADPDFQVLEGFKLLNLIPRIGTKSKSENKPIKTAPNKCETKSSQTEGSDEEKSGLVKLYKGCDRTTTDVYGNSDDVSSETKPGSQPWLALVVPRARPRRVLCYAALVHPRAAVTAAGCVRGYASRSESREIELAIGQWDLSDEHLQPQRRTVEVYTDPDYDPNSLAHSLAILHWNTPLRTNKNVNPICLTTLNDNDDSCSFVGWGGKGEELASRPSLERASLLGARECSRRVHGRAPSGLPRGALCAVGGSRAVTDIGGALFCSRGEVKTLAAIVVWSESKPRSPFILLPVHKWVNEAFKRIDIS